MVHPLDTLTFLEAGDFTKITGKVRKIAEEIRFRRGTRQLNTLFRVSLLLSDKYSLYISLSLN